MKRSECLSKLPRKRTIADTAKHEAKNSKLVAGIENTEGVNIPCAHPLQQEFVCQDLADIPKSPIFTRWLRREDNCATLHLS